MDDQGTNRESGGMRFRKLRIAWSVAWGLSCVLLIALWVRSYQWTDKVGRRSANGRTTTFVSNRGSIKLLDDVINLPRKRIPAHGWQLSTGEYYHLAKPPAFEWRTSGNFTVVRVPSWFLVFSLSGLGILPWLRWKYSLRTLLIAITLVAVGLGLVVYVIRK